MWKAIGAGRSVLSWLCYGVPMRFVSLPPRISFALTTLSTNLLFKGKVYTLGDGRFIPVETSQAYHPVMVIEQGPKIRCIIRTEDYAKNVIDPGDSLLTEDLAKDYFKINVEKSVRPFQCFECGNISLPS